MSDLKPIELIKKLMEEHHITAYDVGKNTSISTSTVKNVIDGTVQPRAKTLNIILDYIQNTIVGSAIPGHKNYRENIIQEAPSNYQTSTNKDILTAVERLENVLLSKLELLASAAETTILNTDEIIDITRTTQDSFSSLAAILSKKGISISK